MKDFNQSSAKGIIICADDFAVNASVSLGITELAAMGRISATSVMVLSARWSQDVAMLQDLRGQIDVGLHLDWTSDFAKSAGHGVSLGAAMRSSLLGGFDHVKTTNAISQQLDLFEDHWQAPPDYVDGHQHVHQFAGIREALLDELIRRYGELPIKPYLRISRAPKGLLDVKSWIIASLGANALESKSNIACFPCASSLLGIYAFNGDLQHYADLMRRWLKHIQAGAILMCHPAQAAEVGDGLGVARVQEFNYLVGPQFAAALTQACVVPARGVVALAPLKSTGA